MLFRSDVEPLETAPLPVLGWDADDSFELIQFPTPAIEEPASIEFAAAPEVVTEEPAWSYEGDEPIAEDTVPLRWAEAPDFSLAEPDLVLELQPVAEAEAVATFWLHCPNRVSNCASSRQGLRSRSSRNPPWTIWIVLRKP